MTAALVIVALVSMLVTAVVAGFETGIYALSHVRLRYRLSVGDRRAKIVEKLLANPQQLLTGILLSQNATLYITTAIAMSLLGRWERKWVETVGVIVLAVVLFIFVEAAPKNIFRRAADVLVYPLAKPFYYVMAAVRPAGRLLSAVSRLSGRLGAPEKGIADPFFSRERLAFYLREGLSEGILSGYQVELAHNILRGERVTVARAMVPLDRVASLPYEADLAELGAISRASRFSRYPVHRGSKERIAGIVNIYDCYLGQPGEFNMEALMRPAIFLSSDTRVIEAVRVLREARQVIGIVGDADRAIGIVTLKDCLEEIVGELYAW